ncbi:uncharacterized protein LOC121728643 [Aricia agestis]|uniref:uncharacterized protein LOC121728643 n=1 Tax=Aricia agestis TaxID=91739 RepID=UPI001C202598|nr:uncharacterized protein LOC121728643 [Aricia agestis]XP_041972800.1 uncharacterized protein LOC121728643 [Aricia agestis]
MACIGITTANADSEMEEGEIVDDLDDLSDISSEEEFLLRERLQVLENYNNVLERTKAKQISLGSNGVLKVECKVIKEPKHTKPYYKYKKPEHKKYIDKENGKSKRKKNIVRRKKSETSEDSDDDYRNKRQKLADAVSLNKPKNDTTSLKDRITKMLSGKKIDDCHSNNEKIERRKSENDADVVVDITEGETEAVVSVASSKSSECIVPSVADHDKKETSEEISLDVVDRGNQVANSEASSDEDIELLRQHALQTKSSKSKGQKESNRVKNVPSSEDEDSDTTELRLICLKSALLKKAIEMKQKQKLQKKLSQSQSELEFDVDLNSGENQTDVESVDMDIGSDGDDKNRGNIIDSNCNNEINTKTDTKSKDDDIEEDEDLLRAKLLTSLTKNLPNLVDPQILNSIVDEPTKAKKIEETKPPDTKEEKKFIIQLGESDSDGEHEATKNLAKMHKKLSEQEEFQRQLDMFLKSSRMEVEKNILPDVVQTPSEKPMQKFVPKTMNSLPRSEQIEYKNLVKRMQELEKIKNARQTLLNMGNKMPPVKDTLKPSNTVKAATINSIELDERIAASRRKIADESAKMLKLKEEATKLSQKYQLLQVELRNVRNAIRINKKFQQTVQNGLSISRLQHQSLLKSLTNAKHSTQVSAPTPLNRPVKITNKLQKENNPSIKGLNNPQTLKAVKVSVVNDFNPEMPHPRLSVQVDITNNKKVVKSNPVQERIVDFTNSNKREEIRSSSDTNTRHTPDDSGQIENNLGNTEEIISDYKSPLDSLRNKSWVEDPNAFLCPFEVGGSCRDPDCKHIHPKTQ